jgi:hypothetical protein|tara:strand:- start:855 stop:1082 length:228 start_codon:yes stop_codon:yes gene_type:complete
MYGLTKDAYRSYVKNQKKPPEKEKKSFSNGSGLLSPNMSRPTNTDTKPISVQEQEKNVAENAFALFKNFNDRYKV